MPASKPGADAVDALIYDATSPEFSQRLIAPVPLPDPLEDIDFRFGLKAEIERSFSHAGRADGWDEYRDVRVPTEAGFP
jgi:hypothetical protein